MLLLTVTVASPFIFMRIWKTSAIKDTAPEAVPVLDLNAGQAMLPQETEPVQTTVTTAPAVSTEVQTGETTSAPEVTTVPETTSEPETTTVPAGYTIGESGDEYFDDALFLGDSRTVGLKNYGTITNADYFCSVGMTILGVGGETVDNRTLDGILASRKFGKIYIMLGVNECGGDAGVITDRYAGVIAKLRESQPDAIIYLLANLHVAKSAETSLVNNERINAVNAGMASLADNENIFFMDVNPVFDGADGALRPELSYDGVHPLAKYYTDWCSWLKMNTVIRDETAEEIDPESTEPESGEQESSQPEES